MVESVVQLTDDGQPKGAMVTDGSRIYFSTGEIERFRIAQVPVTGGSTILAEARMVNSIPVAMAHDSPGLVFMAANTIVGSLAPSGGLWLLPLPVGEPRQLGNIETPKADVFPDGRIIFAAPIQGTQI